MREETHIFLTNPSHPNLRIPLACSSLNHLTSTRYQENFVVSVGSPIRSTICSSMSGCMVVAVSWSKGQRSVLWSKQSKGGEQKG
jgi:hypothetical protein